MQVTRQCTLSSREHRLAAFARIVLLAVLSGGLRAAELASPTQMADAALAAEIGTGSESARASRIATNIGRLSSLAQSAPTQRTGGVVVFNEGLNPTEFAAWASDRNLRVTRVELKIPALDGTVHTASIGPNVLLREDDLMVGINRAIARARGQIYLMSLSAPPDEGRILRDAAQSSNLRFYKVNVISTASSLAALQQDPRVRAVLVDLESHSVRAFDEFMEEVALEKKQLGGKRIVVTQDPSKAGPPRGVPGVPEDAPITGLTAERARLEAAKSKSEAASARSRQ